MTQKNNDGWDVRDSESIVMEFEHYFYAPDPNLYSVEGSHAIFTETLNTDNNSL